MIPLLILVLVIAICVLLALHIDRLNRKRIREQVSAKGGKVFETRLSLFSENRQGKRDFALYRVRYRDRDGNEHRATCKSGERAKVEFLRDTIVRSIPAVQRRGSSPTAARKKPEEPESATTDRAEIESDANVDDLMAENRRLKEEVGQLRAGMDAIQQAVKTANSPGDSESRPGGAFYGDHIK